MASTIKIKRSGVAGKQPNTASLSVGELAINYKDQKLYSSNGTAVFELGGGSGGLVSTTTSLVKNLTQNDTVVTGVTAAVSTNYLQVSNASATYATKAYAASNSYVKTVLANTNSYIATRASWTALTGTNTAIRALVSDRLQVANAATIYQTKAVERAALANTNASIATQATRITLVNTNLTGTNTALRTLISDRLQVANASTLYATKSNPATSGLLAHTGRATISTNLYVAGNTILGNPAVVTDRTVINGVTVANGQLSVSGNTTLGGTLVANNTAGVSGYYLRTSGTGVYWSPVSGGGGSAANGFSGILVGANVVSADSTTDRLTLVAGSGITLAGNPTTDTITISSSTTTAGIGFLIDGGGSAITTGIKGDLQIPFNSTITSWSLMADQSGSAVVDIWKDTFANYPPTVADTITGSAKPTLTSQTSATSSTLTGWTTSITAGDTLRFNIDSSTTITRLTLSLNLTRT